jgi:UDP:flavonoid glycosyltransferase YjiC (YdhE family)
VRILFTFIGGAGHLHPLIPVARAAQAAGHTVAVAGGGSAVRAAEAVGLTTFPTSEPRTRPRERTPLAALDPETEHLRFADTFANRGARRHAPLVLALGREWRPDVIVRDEADIGSAIAAEVLAIPTAIVLVLATGTLLRRTTVAGPLRELRAEYGLPPDPAMEMLDGDLVLAPFPPVLRAPGYPLPVGAFPFRPSAAVPPRSTARPPTVYFTLGTVFDTASGDLISRVLTGLRKLPVHVVATVGEHLDPAVFGRQPARIRIERYVPQEQVLPRCDLVVSHGGSGSLVGALAHGLLSVLLPIGADQPHNARRCAELGVARVLDPHTATPGEVRAAVAAALADRDGRRAAQRVQHEINALPGPEETVPHLERLATPPLRSTPHSE